MKRSKFSLSHYKLLSMNGGGLYPAGLIEVLPGDSIQLATSALVRASPLVTPVMHPVHVRIHHFYVPHRLVWEDWEDFITGGPDGDDASVFPTISITNPAVSSLADYLGIPVGTYTAEVSALPFRGYALIWNEWFRDQDLQSKLTVDITAGADTTTNTTLQNVCWEKDYFTSARLEAQKGTAVTIAIGGEAPVKGIGLYGDSSVGNISAQAVRESDDSDPTYAQAMPTNVSSRVAVEITADAADAHPMVFADLSQAGAIDINTLREALATQRFMEARSRYGSRYTEYLRYLGVRSSDSRLQRPEYLGGGRETIQFSEVLQTGVTTSGNTAGVGTLRGHGIGSLRSNRFRRFIEEHGYIFSFVSIKPKSMYYQGLWKTWNRRVKEDFWQKELQHIGQQEVLNKELYAMHATPNGVFGYQDRYDEYRRMESSVGGEFRTSTLNNWHMARDLSGGADPELNDDFVSCVPTERTFAVPSNDVYMVMAHHNVQARRLVAPVGTSFTF